MPHIRLFSTLHPPPPRIAAALTPPPREARLEAQVLTAHALGVNRAWLLAHGDERQDSRQLSAIQTLIDRRATGEPVAYLVGEREFYGLVLRVTPDVLIPRPETETLVEAALERIPEGRPCRILDLGTGSGAVALALAVHRPDIQVTAIDVSAGALAVARSNAQDLDVKNVHFLHSDWYGRLGVKNFDMVLANPPYVAEGDRHLSDGDLRFEPQHALRAGPDGMEAIRTIVSLAPRHLASGGWILLEHGYEQGDACRRELLKAGFREIFTLADLGGQPRVSGGRLEDGQAENLDIAS